MENKLLEHGGRIKQAAKQFGIPVSDWLDLSTGINPNSWPVHPVPTEIWQRLPEDDDELYAAAQFYYGPQMLLPAAGTQALIQVLPQLRQASVVAVPNRGYEEHRHGWQREGHELKYYQHDDDQQLDQLINAGEVDVVVVINPNNPTTQQYTVSQLLSWRENLAARGGWLVVDEAFIDTTPEFSLLPYSPLPGLIVLRSMGKFFGLAGLRLGFLFAEESLLQAANFRLGPWTIAGPSRWQAAQALLDIAWQEESRRALRIKSDELLGLLQDSFDKKIQPIQYKSTALFVSVMLPVTYVNSIAQTLAEQGILVRRFMFNATEGCLRFGLPKNEDESQRLRAALNL